MTCPRSLHGGQSGSRTHDPPVKSYRLNQGATMSHIQLSSVCCACCLAIKLVCTEQVQHFEMLVYKSVSVWGHDLSTKQKLNRRAGWQSCVWFDANNGKRTHSLWIPRGQCMI